MQPKVPIATYSLPKNLARFCVRKSVFFACFCCSHGRFYVAKWPGYVANRRHRGFFAIFCYFIDYFIKYLKADDKGTKRNRKPLLSYSIAVIILPLARLCGEVARLYDKAHYPQLTPTAKEKILGLNAARLYGLDPEQVRAAARHDDLAWVKAALEEYHARGTPAIG